jgi:hypothetical protein
MQRLMYRPLAVVGRVLLVMWCLLAPLVAILTISDDPLARAARASDVYLILLLLCTGTLAVAAACFALKFRLTRRFDPNASRARSLCRRPTEEEWGRFAQAKGRSRAEVIRILGRPCVVGEGHGYRKCWWYYYDGWVGVGFQEGIVAESGLGPRDGSRIT